MFSIEIKDLEIAYRKVKADLFYSGNPHRIALAEFEKNLSENLQIILDALRNKDNDFFMKISEGYWICPKKIDAETPKNKIITSDSKKEFSAKKNKKVYLRIMERLPVAFHVITTLWINKTGIKFDQKLSDSAYGNRIRCHKNREPNLLALGTFNYYLYHYRKWRDDGLKAIRGALEDGKSVIAITADFSAFYHNINASFIASKKFQRKIGIRINNKEEIDFTSLIVEMLNHWAETTPIKKGLPVGCSISAVIANAALALFDQKIEKEIVPLYYGRYVDDIILVLKNSNSRIARSKIWEWIEKRIPELKRDSQNDKINYDLDADLCCSSTKNKLSFEESKTKVFFLEPQSGLAFLGSLERQIKNRSSEWRLLPELPDEKHIPSMLLSACSKTGEEVDKLRNADSLSTKRAAFAMKLRDLESYCRNLPHNSWDKQRKAFLNTILSHFTTPDIFFELFRYFPRIISIATACSDYDICVSIIEEVYENCCKILKKELWVADVPINNDNNMQNEIRDSFANFICNSFYESIISSLNSPDSFPKIKNAFNSRQFVEKSIFADLLNKEENGKKYLNLYVYDLANTPFRHSFFPEEISLSFDRNESKYSFGCCSLDADTTNTSFLNAKDLASLRKLAEKLGKQTIPQAWIFPTRPFSMPELFLCLNDALDETGLISNVMHVLRGYSSQPDLMPIKSFVPKQEGKAKLFTIQNTRILSILNIALTSWKTEQSSWIASARKEEDPDRLRFRRLSHLLNQIIMSHNKVNYVVFPELSIPPKWFPGLAFRLKKIGISLIGGVEYIHREKGVVSNQVWCSLLHDGLGFSQSVIVKQDKLAAAIHEEEDLRCYAGVKLAPENKDNKCVIIKHGDFYFGILICSELTNIDYRAKFRGYVDAIFVPEWNQDTEMFGSLIEAAAYDVHAYIIQCNDRRYGDTRIRIPAKQHYDRDIVKIKGGEEDYFVIGKLDINKLRQFQSNMISPTGESAQFKPVPVGFAIAPYRECLPKENNDKH